MWAACDGEASLGIAWTGHTALYSAGAAGSFAVG